MFNGLSLFRNNYHKFNSTLAWTIKYGFHLAGSCLKGMSNQLHVQNKTNYVLQCFWPRWPVQSSQLRVHDSSWRHKTQTGVGTAFVGHKDSKLPYFREMPDINNKTAPANGVWGKYNHLCLKWYINPLSCQVVIGVEGNQYSVCGIKSSSELNWIFS